MVGRWRRAPRSARARCRPRTRSGGGCGSAPRSCSPSRFAASRCSSPSRPTCGGPRSRWTWRSSRHRRHRHVPAARPVDGRRGPQLLLPRPAAWRRRSAHRRGAGRGYNLALAVLFALTAAAVFALGGTLWAAARPRRPACAAGRCWRRARVVVCLVLGNLAGARAWLDARRAARRLRLVRALAGDPGHDQRVPVSLLLGDLHAHVLALPFTLLALAFALQVALAGPRGAPSCAASAEELAAGLAIGVAVRDQLVVVAGDRRAARRSPSLVWLRDPAAPAARLAGRPGGARAAGERRARAAVLARASTRRATGIGLVDERAAVQRASWATSRCSTGSRVACWRPPSRRRLRAARRPARAGVGAAWRRSSPARCWPPLDLAGAPALAARSPRRWRALRSRACAAPERVLWLLVAGGLACLLAARARLRARRVRRRRPVPHEHRLQARLPGVVPARHRRRVRAGGAGAGLPRRAWPLWAAVARRARCCSARLPRRRARTRARAASRARRRSTGAAGCRPAPGDPPRIDWLREQHAAATRSCSRPSATTTRPSATRASRPSPAARRCSAGRATSCSGATTRAAARADVAQLYTTADLARGAPAARPLRHRLRGRRALERTTYGDAGSRSGRLGRRVLRAARHDDLARLAASAAHVDPLGHPAGRVPRLARREPAPPARRRHLAVVAHPPDAEPEARGRRSPGAAGARRSCAACGEDQHVGVRAASPAVASRRSRRRRSRKYHAHGNVAPSAASTVIETGRRSARASTSSATSLDVLGGLRGDEELARVGAVLGVDQAGGEADVGDAGGDGGERDRPPAPPRRPDRLDADAGQQHQRQQRVQHQPGELLARPRVDGQRDARTPRPGRARSSVGRRSATTAPTAPSSSTGHSCAEQHDEVEDQRLAAAADLVLAEPVVEPRRTGPSEAGGVGEEGREEQREDADERGQRPAPGLAGRPPAPAPSDAAARQRLSRARPRRTCRRRSRVMNVASLVAKLSGEQRAEQRGLVPARAVQEAEDDDDQRERDAAK